MACDVDAHHATEVAVRILRKYGVYERPMGLVGVRGLVVSVRVLYKRTSEDGVE